MEWAARLPLAAGAGDLHRAADQRGKRRARAQLVEELGREHRLFRPALADVVPAFRAGADEDDGRNANAADQRDERGGDRESVVSGKSVSVSVDCGGRRIITKKK